MLKNFLYLNEAALDGCLSAMEGGLRGSSEQQTGTSSTHDGGVDVKVARAGGGRTRSESTMMALSDTPHTRFDRLEELASADVTAPIHQPSDESSFTNFIAAIAGRAAYIKTLGQQQTDSLQHDLFNPRSALLGADIAPRVRWRWLHRRWSPGCAAG